MKKITALCTLILFVSCSAGHYIESSETTKNSNNIFADTKTVSYKTNFEKKKDS